MVRLHQNAVALGRQLNRSQHHGVPAVGRVRFGIRVEPIRAHQAADRAEQLVFHAAHQGGAVRAAPFQVGAAGQLGHQHRGSAGGEQAAHLRYQRVVTQGQPDVANTGFNGLPASSGPGQFPFVAVDENLRLVADPGAVAIVDAGDVAHPSVHRVPQPGTGCHEDHFVLLGQASERVVVVLPNLLAVGHEGLEH